MPRFLFCVVLCALYFVRLGGAAYAPAFEAHNIVTGLKMGYQLVLADLNGDGKTDVIVVDELSNELAWYESPDWRRHVLARDVPRTINLDCRDLDGDGIPEVAMAHDFETNPDRSKGTVLLLEHSGDPREPWKKTEIDHVPTAHRLRWIPVEKGKSPWLLVAPLVGAKTHAPAYDGIAPIYAYRPGEWKRMTISRQLRGVLHSIAPVEWKPGDWQLLTASFDGIVRLEPNARGIWRHIPVGAGNPEACPRCGSSEVKMGALGKHRFLATIEPWHGNQIAVYLERKGLWRRAVLDEELQNGHALAVGDLDGDGRDEIVSGFRGKGFRITVYAASDETGVRWRRTVLDRGGVAGADCKIADLNGDQRPDIACSGASTGNVMLFENQGKRRRLLSIADAYCFP